LFDLYHYHELNGYFGLLPDTRIEVTVERLHAERLEAQRVKTKELKVERLETELLETELNEAQQPQIQLALRK